MTLNWVSYDPGGISGYTCESRSFVNVIRDELDVDIYHLSLQSFNHNIDNLKRESPRNINSFFIHHLFPHQTTKSPSGYNIVRTMLECTGIPGLWVQTLNSMDEVWVPSAFNYETFINSGVKEDILKIVHEPVNNNLFLKGHKKYIFPSKKGFKFLTLFTVWSKRKGWDILLRAYIEEFSKDEDVSLVIKAAPFICYKDGLIYTDIYKYINDFFGRSKDDLPEIIILDNTMESHIIAGIYHSVDCFVLPSRGEGWGRPYMEAMISGLPVIGTGWSGNLEFMNNNNSCLLDYDLVDIPEDSWLESYFLAGFQWAEPSFEHLKFLLRTVFNNKGKFMDLGFRGKEDILRKFSPSIIADNISKRLFAIKKRKRNEETISKSFCYIVDVAYNKISGSGDRGYNIQLKIDKIITYNNIISVLTEKKIKRIYIYGTKRASDELSEVLMHHFSILGYLDRSGFDINLFKDKGITKLVDGPAPVEILNNSDAVILCAYPGCYKYVINCLLTKGFNKPIIPLILFYK